MNESALLRFEADELGMLAAVGHFIGEFVSGFAERRVGSAFDPARVPALEAVAMDLLAERRHGDQAHAEDENKADPGPRLTSCHGPPLLRLGPLHQLKKSGDF